jgi:hypothetical protein
VEKSNRREPGGNIGCLGAPALYGIWGGVLRATGGGVLGGPPIIGIFGGIPGMTGI